MKISDETKVGILAAFGIIILIIGYSFLRGNNVFSKKEYYYVKYQKVDGLSASDPVTYSGYPVGKVAGLSLMHDEEGIVLVTLTFHQDLKIPNDSRFEIYSSDLLGEKAIRLIKGKSTDFVSEGDTLLGDLQASLTEEVSMQILPVKLKAENLLGSIDSVMTVLTSILKGGQIESSLTTIESAISSFERVAKNIDTLVVTQRETLGKVFTNMEGITANLDSNSENITRMLENLAGMTDSLSEANLKELTNNLSKALSEMSVMLENINNGQGTVGMLMTDKKLYDNLTKSTKNLESLLADLEANPKRYVQFSLFGGGGGDKRDKKKEDPANQ